jgi:hypothetical protein
VDIVLLLCLWRRLRRVLVCSVALCRALIVMQT